VRTYSPKPGDTVEAWHVIDATDVVLGRLATQVAVLIRGKNKPAFAPHLDCGDHVIVINASKIALTGTKATDTIKYRHSGFIGGLTATPIGELLQKDPRKVVENAVRGMLPHTRLGRAQMAKLKVYAEAEHPHAAQKPQPYSISQVAQ
jgi:large subunit ribosomal protein L13